MMRIRWLSGGGVRNEFFLFSFPVTVLHSSVLRLVVLKGSTLQGRGGRK